MRTLVIETATEACSVALFDGEAGVPPGDKGGVMTLLAHRHETIGRGHVERLIPLIALLPEHGRADRILVSLGPGSFTGTRIGIAAARALGVAWGAKVAGFPTLALVAATYRAEYGAAAVGVAMTGGHGEYYVQSFDTDGQPHGDHASLPPELAARQLTGDHVTGNTAEALVALRGFGAAYPALPDARCFAQLAPSSITPSVSPIYGRAPDAKLPA